MNALRRLWYRYSPQLLIGELLEKRWMEPIVPFALLILVFIVFILTIPGYTSLAQLQQLMRSFPEQAFVAMAMAISILSGGLDLSVGAVFAMADFLTLYLMQVRDWPLPLTIVAVLGLGRADRCGKRRTDCLCQDASLPDDHGGADHPARSL